MKLGPRHHDMSLRKRVEGEDFLLILEEIMEFDLLPMLFLIASCTQWR